MHDIKRNKNENVCERNFDGRFFEELPRRDVQHITSNEDHDCFGELFASEGSLIFLPKLGSKFSRTKNFCCENWIFLLAYWLRHV